MTQMIMGPQMPQMTQMIMGRTCRIYVTCVHLRLPNLRHLRPAESA
jgi:hypothetical protein